MSHRPQNLIALLLTLVTASSAVCAQNYSPAEPSEKALEAIISTIEDVQAEINRRSSQRASVYQTLQESEKALAVINRDIASTQSAIDDNEASLARLQADSEQLNTRKAAQQTLIHQYIRSAYQTGRQEYFKLLLNQENPALAARTLRYYRYFNDARSDKVAEFNATLDELRLVENRIKETTQSLNDQRQALASQQASLQSSFNERQVLLDELDVILSSSETRLVALEAERAEMELLIEELRRSIANLTLGDQQQPFASLKGRLPWPVEGRLENNWGSSYGLGDLSWQGVTINTGAGNEVRAIHHGRVVFSDWFSSSGLLLIIDHGGGYMSLYAHNQALYKDVGEWVNSGEVITSVGNTGGQEEYGLYFEIRHNGESENPSSWFQARN